MCCSPIAGPSPDFYITLGGILSLIAAIVGWMMRKPAEKSLMIRA